MCLLQVSVANSNETHSYQHDGTWLVIPGAQNVDTCRGLPCFGKRLGRSTKWLYSGDHCAMNSLTRAWLRSSSWLRDTPSTWAAWRRNGGLEPAAYSEVQHCQTFNRLLEMSSATSSCLTVGQFNQNTLCSTPTLSCTLHPNFFLFPWWLGFSPKRTALPPATTSFPGSPGWERHRDLHTPAPSHHTKGLRASRSHSLVTTLESRIASTLAEAGHNMI